MDIEAQKFGTTSKKHLDLYIYIYIFIQMFY